MKTTQKTNTNKNLILNQDVSRCGSVPRGVSCRAMRTEPADNVMSYDTVPYTMLIKQIAGLYDPRSSNWMLQVELQHSLIKRIFKILA